MAKGKTRHLAYGPAIVLLAGALVYFFLGSLLAALGGLLVMDDKPLPSQAVVVLSTGIEYTPRLIEAAELFREGYAEKVVINGNRKSEALRALEKKGFRPCCPWYEDPLRVLSLLGVPRDRVITLSAEDAYDTVSEAEIVGKGLIDGGITRIIIVTSKYHTRRARYIWQHGFPNRFSIRMVAARTDPYTPGAWWKDGRQIRWLLAEYGAWIYYFWKTIRKID